ncbi:MAG: hypothetical protein QNI84_07195 [Henriciella sp.]|nr:hypothetical protein [Henriciella sp.]
MADTRAIQFQQSSFIPNVSRDEVWQQVGSWEGVNYELGPVFRMSYPNAYAQLADIPADGKSYFSAGVRLFGLVPVDQHKFSFTGFDAPNSFDERSSNFNMTLWTHRRTLIERDGGVEITDTCSFVPRLPFMGGVLKSIFAWVFKRRHQRLIRHFATV